MQNIAIHLFGPVAVATPDTEIRISRSSLRLLAYLALYAAQPVPREVVAAELWPDCDEKAARSRLSTALWRLRAALDETCGDFLRDDGDALIGLAPAAVEAVDTRRFERRAKAFLADPGDRYWDDLAEDDRGRGAPMAGWYDMWALSARMRLEDLRERCLSELLDRQFAAGEDQPATDTADKLLRIDPLREDVHQTLMRVHMRRGRPGLALRQYERCRQVMKAELGIEPMAETEALLSSLLQSRRSVRRARPAEAADLGEFRRRLSEARAGLDQLSSMIDTMLER